MRIGIEASAIGQPSSGGMRTFLHYALAELEKRGGDDEYFVYTSASAEGAGLPFSKTNPRWHLRPARGLLASLKYVLWLQAGFPKQARRDGIDALWTTRHILPLTRRIPPCIATIFDLFYCRVPGVFPWYRRSYMRAFTLLTVRRAKKIVATSKATAQDLQELLDVPPRKIEVAYGGVDRSIFYPREAKEAERTLSGKWGIRKPFVLAVDAHNVRKNCGTLLRAYARLPSRLQDEFDVVATGNPYSNSPDLRQEAARLGLDGKVRWTGYVPHQEMPLLYSAAAALAFPSLYEGFGLPIVEAMACGCPVITSNVSSMPEVAAPAALMADPTSPDDLGRSLRQVLENAALREDLRGRGLEHSKRFEWRSFAETVRQALGDAALGSPAGGD